MADMVPPLTPAEIVDIRARLFAAPPPVINPQLAGGFIGNVAAGQTITSAWGNLIRDSATIHFATKADRDLYWPAATAPLGAMCTTEADGDLWELTDRSGARRWTPPWSVAWGTVAQVAVAQSQTGIGSAYTDVAGMFVTWQAIGGRSYWMRAHVIAQQSTSTGVVEAAIRDNGGGVLISAAATVAAGSFTTIIVDRLVQGLATSVDTRKLSIKSNAGTVAVVASSVAELTITDFGPASPAVLEREVDDA